MSFFLSCYLISVIFATNPQHDSPPTHDKKPFIIPPTGAKNHSVFFKFADKHSMRSRASKRSSRHLLGYNDRNKVELYVMSDPSYTKLFKDHYGSNWYSNLVTHVKDIINDASTEYEWWNWGSIGHIELAPITLEIVEDFSGIYTSLSPPWHAQTTCKDWSNRDCYIDGVKYLNAFRSFFKQYNRYGDSHLMLSQINFAGAQGWGGVGTVCKAGSAGIVDSEHYWRRVKTIAHELGHNFGMQHTAPAIGIMGSSKYKTDDSDRIIFKEDPITGERDLDLTKMGWSTSAEGKIADYFEKADLKCLRDGIRSFKTIDKSSTPSTPGTDSGSSPPSSSGNCIDVEGLSSKYNGEWQQSGSFNGRDTYKKGSYWLYTALDSAGVGGKVWTIDYSKSKYGVNKDYHCLKTFITKCSGKWLRYGREVTNSVFAQCGSFSMEGQLECLEDDVYDENVCVFNNNGTYNEFEIVHNMCYNNKPIYEYVMDDISYHLYYDEFYEYVNSEDMSYRWVISLYEVNSENIFAECDETDLFECVEGSWQISYEGNDSLAMVMDPKMKAYNGKCSNSSTKKESNATTVIGFVAIALALIVLLSICGFFFYQQYRSRKLKKIAADVIVDESEEDYEEIEVEVPVETND